MHFETFDPVSDPILEPPQALDATLPSHPEDAFLAAVARAVRCSQAERRVLRALACEALEQADGPDGDFAQLDVDGWLQAVAACARLYDVDPQRVRLLALAIVAHLTDACLLDVVTAASLRRELRDQPCGDATVRPLAA
jgi:hypothetical protein